MTGLYGHGTVFKPEKCRVWRAFGVKIYAGHRANFMVSFLYGKTEIWQWQKKKTKTKSQPKKKDKEKKVKKSKEFKAIR